jgi:aspartyl-tRNA(Asn)/glutamyl-tRNA(Gln) amidotransferase subunit B
MPRIAPRIAPSILTEYLLYGRLPSHGCLRTSRRPLRLSALERPAFQQSSCRLLHSSTNGADTFTAAVDNTVSYRKQLKDEAKRKKALKAQNGGQKAEQSRLSGETIPGWELTVGIEIHAQLNTRTKLFSPASTTTTSISSPNTHVSLFDTATPGSQPLFQRANLIPALRAALALNCTIQPISKFDRKHYFHWDQPAGYQITQYYYPFARDGYITLYKRDGIAEEDGEQVTVGIKQIQMEQDTAKTIAQPGGIHLVDFNRAGTPLVEIITLPSIHHPATAAALVRKIQILLQSVDACVLGMESGGLRADVNVSVRPVGTEGMGQSYAGVGGLGQRTEIKNLSSFRAVRDAIIAERNRQIAVLEGGGVIEGETRGWTLGSSETRRLRGKEGEVDYRYMPDADLAPVVIGKDLLQHLSDSMGVLPDAELEDLTNTYGLSTKDALSLVSLDAGARAEYFYRVVDALEPLCAATAPVDAEARSQLGKMVGNWVLHELGGLLDEDATSPTASSIGGEEASAKAEPDTSIIDPEGNCPLFPAAQLARLLFHLQNKRITGATAKSVLASLVRAPVTPSPDAPQVVDIDALLDAKNLWFSPLSDAEYELLAREVVREEEKAVAQIRKAMLEGKAKNAAGKVMFLVGLMMRKGERGRVDAKVAEGWVRRVVLGQMEV